MPENEPENKPKNPYLEDLIKRRIDLRPFDEAEPEPWETPLPEPPVEKPRIRIPARNRTISDFAIELAQHIRYAEPYYRGDKMFVRNDPDGHYEEMTPAKFVTWIEKHVNCFEGEAGEDGQGGNARSINATIAQAVLACEQFRDALPRVRQFHAVREPVFDRQGAIRLLRTGYDEQTGTLTARGSVQYSLEMNLETARNTLNRLMEEFPFVNPEQGRAMQVAAMLTAYGMGLLSETCVIPAFIYNSNDAGAGKGLLVSLALAPVEGHVANTSPVSTEAEMEKRLFATARNQQRFLVLDNMEVAIKSKSLVMFITSSVYKGRVLGTSKEEAIPKKTATFITGNNLVVNPDMRRRSLVLEFFLRAIRPESRMIQHPLDLQGILAQRAHILAALYSLIREWVAANKPAPSRTHPSFVEWSNVIAGIVEHAGFGCPIPAVDLTTDIDPRTADIERLVERMHEAARLEGFTFYQVVQLCRQHELFEEELPTSETARKANTRFSKMLKGYHGREFPGRRVLSIRGIGHARRYHVVAQAALPAAAQGQGPEELALPAPAQPTVAEEVTPLTPTPEPLDRNPPAP